MNKLAGWFLKYRYLILGLIVLVGIGMQINSSLRSGDFWEHSSVIRELATHPLHPQNPQLMVAAPSAFFTPYHLILALITRLMRESAVDILLRAGIFNLALFLLGLYLFISVIEPRHPVGASFYSLLLVLFLWGAGVWNYSGFFHLRGLARISPYPSVFALGLSLVALWMDAQRLDKKREIWLIPIFFITVIVLLTHPITFFFLAAGLAAFSLRTSGKLWMELVKLAGLLGLSFALAALWPYYPFLKLLLGSSTVYHDSNQVMYQFVLLRIWPLLIGVPLLAIEIYRAPRSPLPWMFLMLLGLYLLGGITGNYSYGRVISYVAIILQITIAIFLERMEERLTKAAQYSNIWQVGFSLVFTFLLVTISFEPFIRPLLTSYNSEGTVQWDKYTWLSRYTNQSDVIMAQLPTSLIVPTISGKVVAFDRPQPFVLDAVQRQEDVLHFFSEKTSQEERKQILSKYKVNFILLEKSDIADWEVLRPLIAPFGDLVFRGKRFLLYKVKIL